MFSKKSQRGQAFAAISCLFLFRFFLVEILLEGRKVFFGDLLFFDFLDILEGNSKLVLDADNGGIRKCLLSFWGCKFKGEEEHAVCDLAVGEVKPVASNREGFPVYDAFALIPIVCKIVKLRYEEVAFFWHVPCGGFLLLVRTCADNLIFVFFLVVESKEVMENTVDL